jgi:phosphoribosylformylglycinamidine (FGAM) synthase-like enzyme
MSTTDYIEFFVLPFIIHSNKDLGDGGLCSVVAEIVSNSNVVGLSSVSSIDY